MDALKNIFDTIKPLMAAYEPPMVATTNYESRYELYTNKPVVIDGRPKPNIAFAGLIIQTGYVGLYFVPIYTTSGLREFIKPELLKLLKGKSCFHVKKIDADLTTQIEEFLRIGFNIYKENGWI